MSGTCGLATVELEPVSGLRRLFGRKSTENAYREVQNLLASTPVRQVGPTAVAELLTEYKLTLADAKPRLLSLYTAAMVFFVRDLELSPAEIDDLRHLRNVFGLSDSDIHDAGGAAYRAALKIGTSDSHLSEGEKARLATLETQLRLPEVMVLEIRREEIGAVVKRAFDAALEDRRLSPAQESQLEALKKNLGANVEIDATNAVALDHFRLLWRLSQDEIPTVQAPILLKRGESCHIFVAATHHELRAGDVLTPLDGGTLYVTDKRLLFDGARKSISISLSKIIGFQPITSGIRVQKDSGKDQFFKMPELQVGQLEIIVAVLAAALRRDRGIPAARRPETLDLAEASAPRGRA